MRTFLISLLVFSFVIQVQTETAFASGKCWREVRQKEQLVHLENHVSWVEKKMLDFKGDVQAFSRAILRSGIRSRLFKIEYTLKLLGSHPEVDPLVKANLKELREFVKEFENAIGKYDLMNDLFKNAKRDTVKDARLVAEYRRRRAEALEDVQRIVTEKGWLEEVESTAFARIRAVLEAQNWLRMDRYFAVEALVAQIKKLEKQIEKKLDPLIRQQDYDYNALEHGFHKFRRNIRKVSIYMASMGDYFAFARIDRSLSKEDQELVDTYKGNRYAKLNKARTDSILVDPVNYYRIVYLVHEIGLVKDRGELIYYVGESLANRPGETRSREELEKVAEKMLSGKVRSEEERVEAQAHALYGYYLQHQPLTVIRESLENWLVENKAP